MHIHRVSCFSCEQLFGNKQAEDFRLFNAVQYCAVCYYNNI